VEIRERTVRVLNVDDNDSPFLKWYKNLRDSRGRATVAARIRRASAGNFGDHKFFEGIGELRIDVGPGYRVYFAIHEDAIIILLIGGDKSSQDKDISTASALWRRYQNETDKFQRGFG